jgi:hypothetical protein
VPFELIEKHHLSFLIINLQLVLQHLGAHSTDAEVHPRDDGSDLIGVPCWESAIQLRVISVPMSGNAKGIYYWRKWQDI